MKTLGQMLMDAYAKADTIDTVALVGDRLVITHKPNACEQIEAAFTEELESFLEQQVWRRGFSIEAHRAVVFHGGENDSVQLRRIAKSLTLATLGIPISKT